MHKIKRVQGLFYSKKNLSKIVIGLVIIVGMITIAYAYLSTTLTLKYNKITQSALTWNVGFVEGTIAATPDSTSSTGFSCGNVTATPTTVTVANTSLSKPGDKCVWELTIQNNGSIDATLETISATAPTGTGVTCTIESANNMMTCGNIIYKIASTATGYTLLTTTNKTITKVTNGTPGTMTVYLLAYYNPTVTELNLGTAIVQNNAQFSLTFKQK